MAAVAAVPYARLSAPILRLGLAEMEVRYGSGGLMPDLRVRGIAEGIDPAQVECLRFSGPSFDRSDTDEDALIVRDPRFIREVVEALKTAETLRYPAYFTGLDLLDIRYRNTSGRPGSALKLPSGMRSSDSIFGARSQFVVADLSRIQAERNRVMLDAIGPHLDWLECDGNRITDPASLRRAVMALATAGYTICGFDHAYLRTSVLLHVRGGAVTVFPVVFPKLDRAAVSALPMPLRRWYPAGERWRLKVHLSRRPGIEPGIESARVRRHSRPERRG